MKYKELVMAVAKVTLHYKYLWFFGLFAAFLSNGGLYQSITGSSSSSLTPDWTKLKETGIFDWSIVSQVVAFAQADPLGLWWRLSVLAVILILGLFILWLAVVAQGGLINNIAKINLGKRTDFKDGVASGRANLWPVFFFKLIEKIILVAVISLSWLSVLDALNYAHNFWLRSLYTLIIALIIVLTAALALGIRYSLTYAVIKGARFIEALGAGFSLLVKNWLVSLESGVIIFILNFLLGSIILTLISALTIPFIFLMFVFYKLALAWGMTITLTLGVIILFVLVAVAGGSLATFNHAFWVTVWLKIAREKQASWLGSIFSRQKS